MRYPKICRHCSSPFISKAKKAIHCSLKCTVLANYRINGECWEWTRSIGSEGYGIVIRKSGRLLAHRVSYSELKGKIPKGLYVLHTCDNRCCINPEHLYCGTLQDNMRDMDSRGRRIIPRLFGEDCHNCRFKESDIPIIRKLSSNRESLRSIAKRYDVNYETIRKIVTRKTWDWIK